LQHVPLSLRHPPRRGDDVHADLIAPAPGGPHKPRLAAQILGHALVTAYTFVDHNKPAVEKVAEAVIEKQELYGDDLNRLLDSVELKKPEIDYMEEETWPEI